MRSIFSYLLVAILLLNIFGYYGVFMGLQYKNDQEISSLLDQDQYDREEAITIKIPLSIPYIGETVFGRVNGDFEYHGEMYKLVKQRLSNDTLSIVCVRNETGKKIKMAMSDYVKTFTDKPSHHQSQGKVVPAFIKDFIGTLVSIQPEVNGWAVTQSFAESRFDLSSIAYTITSPPPRG
jgi:hypothetical protein